jgi:hypothetical protein
MSKYKETMIVWYLDDLIAKVLELDKGAREMRWMSEER